MKIAPTAVPLFPRRRSVLPLTMMAGFAAAYWSSFIYFYLDDRWHTTPALNLIINAGFGAVYTVGCIVTFYVCRRLSPRHMLLTSYAILIAITLASALMQSPAGVAVTVFAHAFIVTWTWPNMEMLAADGHHGESLGNAISNYNICWALTAAISFAGAGYLYRLNHLTLFVVPSVFFLGAIVYVWLFIPKVLESLHDVPTIEEEPGEELVKPQFKNLMRDLSRWGNLGCYILISTLMPIMPTITRKLGLDTAEATAFGAIWLLARVSAFFILGRWHGWHFKLSFFLIAVAFMPIAFGIIVLSDSVLIVGITELMLGLALGMVYTSALFYSLHGQAETGQAAVHEAVIGGGIMLGPLIASTAGRVGEFYGWAQTPMIAVTIIVIMVLMAGVMIGKALLYESRNLARS